MTFTADSLSAELAEFANDLADIAARETMPIFRTAMSVDNKSAKSVFDPVTAADRAAETAIRDHIQAHYPEHSIRGEEFEPHRGDSALTWVIDPIDGTKAFIVGVPVWATLIGLLDGDRATIGVMDQPFVGDRYVGTPQGAYNTGPNGTRRLTTRDTETLDAAILASSDPYNFRDPGEASRFHALRERVMLTRFGGDAYFYCLLAAGHIDIVTDPGMDDYDIVALIPLIEGAGGVVTTWQGEPATSGGTILATANPRLHDAVLNALSG